MVVVGLGEVGGPIYNIFAETSKFVVYGYDVDPLSLRVGWMRCRGLSISSM